MPAVLACPACGASTVGLARRFAPSPLRECATCGHVFLAGVGQDDVRGIYDEAYFAGYAGAGYEEDSQRRHEAAMRLDWIAAHVPPPARLLEAGSAGGYLLAEAGRRGYEALGVEPAEAEAQRARTALGVQVVTGFLGEAALPAGQPFDVACAFHVLEHVPAPVDALAALRSVLRSGGRLFLEVPNARSTVARVRGAKWPLLGLPGHVHQFGPESLRRAVERAGFQVVDVRTLAMYAYFRADHAREPARVAGRLAVSVLSRTAPTGRHPSRHELLRLVARYPRR